MIVIDASVAVKWFLPEPLGEEAVALLAENEVRAAPEHILVEVGQTLIRSWRTGGITLDHAREAVNALSQLLQLSPTRDIAVRAIEIAADASCTNYDALYLAAAERWDATFVTADRRLEQQLVPTRWHGCVRLLVTKTDR